MVSHAYTTWFLTYKYTKSVSLKRRGFSAGGTWDSEYGDWWREEGGEGKIEEEDWGERASGLDGSRSDMVASDILQLHLLLLVLVFPH